MPLVEKALEVYTTQMANLIRTEYLFYFLAREIRTSSGKAKVVRARKEFFERRGRSTMIRTQFGHDLVTKCHKLALNKCFLESEKHCVKDGNSSPCSVCFENSANYYLIHGNTAHKCVCGRCAMKLALQRKRDTRGKEVPPQCPICRETITYIVKSAPQQLECVCKQARCNRHLVVMQKADGLVKNVPDELLVACECHTCTLEMKGSSPCSMVFGLHVTGS